MINWSSKHIALIALFFLAAFAGVLTTSALCDLEIISYAPNLAHNHRGESDNSGHHNHDTHDHSHHNSEKSQPNSNAEDPCCDDLMSQLESSLFSKITKHQIIDAKYFLIRVASISNKLISFCQSIKIIYHEYDSPPPLSGVGIRVFIQSFLN